MSDILASIAWPREALDSAVTQYRDMAARMEMVLADHWDIEDLAAGIEQLTFRLDSVLEAVTPHLDDDGPVGDLARRVASLIRPSLPTATELVRRHLDLPEPDGKHGYILGEELVYGHPNLRRVVHLDLTPGGRPARFPTTVFLVHAPSGTITEIPDGADIYDHVHRAETTPA